MNEKIIGKHFGEKIKLIAEKKCPACEKEINMDDFKDRLSKKEFEISGLCQSCQDEMFK